MAVPYNQGQWVGEKRAMRLVDQQGRLLGKVSLLDLGALAIVVAAIVAVLFLPGRQAGSVVQVGGGPTLPVEVDMIVRGVSSRSLEPFQAGQKADLIIRNQPYGQVEVVRVENVSRTVPVVFPDGRVENLPDPEPYRFDLVFTLRGRGQQTENGIVLGNNRVKVGVPLELETFGYNLRGTVMDVRLLQS
ncbi:hypothetical protein SYN65AY6LI_13510 [Synechococcus sp. 65AY6Li]|jgi:hypothetical protein|uniref:DUF4330 domain-containing protein n=1 Tax=Synechococcus sp. 65AY6Li TaxID=1351840 RepID=UPI000C3E4ECD|nr:DUF4330 domain-containing protein [Synechococcus sp. 65AY6Li]PIK89926.1 hypothetical protein SYN65AY6LI_13510 [Synechococcus sp. 65AY6Li]